VIRGGPPLDFEFEGLPAPSHTDLMVSPEDVEWQLSEAETAPPLAQAIVPQAIVEAEQQMIDQTVSVPHHDSAREPVEHCPIFSDDAPHRI